MLVHRDEMFFFGSGFDIGDDDFAFSADGSPDFDGPVDLGDFGSILWSASLEELGNPRETPSDVLGFGDFPRSLGEK